MERREIARIVLDTNLLVGALTNPGGASGSLVELWRRGEVEVVVSDETLREAEMVLGGGWVARLAAKGERNQLLEDLRNSAIRVAAPQLPDLRLKDAGDRRLVEAAVAAQAKFIATSDREMLLQRGYGSVEFLTAPEVLDRLRQGSAARQAPRSPTS